MPDGWLRLAFRAIIGYNVIHELEGQAYVCSKRLINRSRCTF